MVCAVIVSESLTYLTPAAAHAAAASLQVLTDDQAHALGVIGEQLVPGARAAGLVEYIDSQLAADDQSLLMLKYLGVDWRQHRGFYGATLDSLVRYLARADANLDQLAMLMATDAIDDWQGPPASFGYFVLRSDAIDVRWGTETGFSDLDIPYVAHIAPNSRW
jgi:hypothetical protein